jgi:hypothetical protein
MADYSRTAERLVLYLMLLLATGVWVVIGGMVFIGIFQA